MARNHRRSSAPMADTADIHALYEAAVQCAESEIDTVDEIYRGIRGRHATLLREDFCGTGNSSCEWVRRRRSNRAIGFDLNPEVLEWGRKHHVSPLSNQRRSRIMLKEHDVTIPVDTAADIVLAMNFSYQIFKTREALRDYFRAVHQGLADDGVLILDAYGGHKSWRTIREKTKYDGFTYIWEHETFNPITAEYLCHIHFKFPDGSRINNAFTYDWRFWTLPELRETLIEAGFSKTTVYWEGTDEESGEGDGNFSATEEGEPDPSWIVYLSAEK